MQGSGLSLGVQSGMYQTLRMRWWNVNNITSTFIRQEA